MTGSAAPVALVVDDDEGMRTLVEYALVTQGFQVECAASAAQAWAMIRAASYDVAIVDVVMPGISGMVLCSQIRETFGIPTIMLTALGEPEHRVQGLEAGADDYMSKPFHPRELALRALALHRWARRSALAEIRNGPLRVEPAIRRASYFGQDVHLSDSEFRVCSLLMERAGRLVGYGELVEAIWGSDDALGGTEMLKTAVWRLRTRLAQIDPAAIIENVRGQGYRMRRLIGPVDGSDRE